MNIALLYILPMFSVPFNVSLIGELTAEISELEKQRDELEAQLKKVNISLNAAVRRLKLTREKRDQFDEANNQMIFS